MVAALSPADYNYEETLSTLRYADRAKSIKNKPKINEDPKDALLKQYENEIQELKAMLMALQQSGATGAQMTLAMNQMQSRIDQHHVVESVTDDVETLLQRLEGKGKKIKIRTEEEEQAEREKQRQLEAERQREMERILDEKKKHEDLKAIKESELQ
jgi:hypothetical protein